VLHDSLVKLIKFITYYIFIDINKLMIPGEIMDRINPILIYVKIFFRVIALLLNLNLGIFIISIIL